MDEALEEFIIIINEKYLNYWWCWVYWIACCKRFVNKYPNYNIYNVDNLTYAGNLSNLKDLEDKNYFFKIDIKNHNEILKLFADKKITDVIHLAEFIVDKSIENSFEFANTNVLGTLSLRGF